MNVSVPLRPTLKSTGWAFAILGTCIGLMACAGSKPAKVPATEAIEPPKGWSLEAGLTIGHPTGLTFFKDVLYISGTEGVAAVGAQGKILWQAKLTPKAFRQVDADPAGIAWTGYDLAGTDVSNGLGRWLGLGDNADLQHFENAACGTLGLDGSAGWQKDLPATSVSGPALNGDLMAFTTEKNVTVLQRKDGAPVSELASSQKGDYKTESNNMRLRPVANGTGFAAANNQWILAIDSKGKETDRLRNKGDLDGIGHYAGGVAVGGGKVVTHYSGPIAYEATDWLVSPQGSIKKMRTRQTTPSSDFVSADGQTYTLTNFVIYADNASGELVWKDVNEKGGLYPGAARGTRKLGSYDFFTRVCPGAFVAEGKGTVMVANHADRRLPDDQIALLDAKNGKPMGHWTATGTVIDMVVAGDALVVIDGRGVAMTQLP